MKLHIGKNSFKTHLALTGIFSAALLSMGASSCQKDNGTASSAAADAAQAAQTLETNKASKMFIDLPSAENANSRHYIHTTSSWIANNITAADFVTPCEIKARTDGSAPLYPDNDVKCLIEADELDLYFNGATFRYNVPPAMCAYMEFTAFDYFAYEPGTISGTITVNKDGLITSGLPTGITSSDSTIAALKCTYDHSATPVNGPNCCEGEITINTESCVTDTNGATNCTMTPTKKDFGGKVSSCIGGPAKDKMPINKFGYPTSLMYNVQSSGLFESFTIDAPIAVMAPDVTYAANYIDPKICNQTTPGTTNKLPVKTTASGFPELSGGATCATSGKTYAPILFPYYQMECYDRAMELQARIRLMVRKWNTVDDFDNKRSANASRTGCEAHPINPDETQPLADWMGWGSAAINASCNNSDGIGNDYPGHF